MKFTGRDYYYLFFVQMIICPADSHCEAIVKRDYDFNGVMPVSRIFFNFIVVIKQDEALIFVLDCLIIA